MSTITHQILQMHHIEGILSGCITAWYGSCSVQNCNKLQKVVNEAQSITQTSLPPINTIYTSRCLGKAHKDISQHQVKVQQVYFESQAFGAPLLSQVSEKQTA